MKYLWTRSSVRSIHEMESLLTRSRMVAKAQVPATTHVTVFISSCSSPLKKGENLSCSAIFGKLGREYTYSVGVFCNLWLRRVFKITSIGRNVNHLNLVSGSVWSPEGPHDGLSARGPRWSDVPARGECKYSVNSVPLDAGRSNARLGEQLPASLTSLTAVIGCQRSFMAALGFGLCLGRGNTRRDLTRSRSLDHFIQLIPSEIDDST